AQILLAGKVAYQSRAIGDWAGTGRLLKPRVARQDSGSGARAQPLFHRVRPPPRASLTTGRFPFGGSGRGQPRVPQMVIECDYPVVKADGEIWDFKLVKPRPGQALQVVAQIVAKEPSRAALKGRQIGNGFRPIMAQTLGEHNERVRRFPNGCLAR